MERGGEEGSKVGYIDWSGRYKVGDPWEKKEKKAHEL